MTTWPTATWLQPGSRARTTLFANTMPSPFLALPAETPPSLTRCVQHLELVVSGGTWIHNSASTIRQGVKANTDGKVLKVKRALNWTGP